MLKSSFPNSMSLLKTEVKTNGCKVAVITRTKNRPILLARAFASVLAQTHEDWHLYVVNDGGERKPIDNLVATYNTAFNGRITVIHHEQGKGMEASSNAALRCSESDFVTIHDDDDSWHPEFLEQCTKFLLTSGNEQYAAVVTYCTKVYERIVENGTIEEERTDWEHNHPFVEFSKMIKQNRFPPIALLTRRSIGYQLGYYNEFLTVLGDWDFALRVLTIGDIGVIPRHLAYYHHRRTVDVSIYGNSVISGINKHKLVNVLYQNSLLRESLQNNISGLGALSATLQAIEEARQETLRFRQATECLLWEQKRAVESIQQSLAFVHMVISWLGEVLRPFRWTWLRILDFRHQMRNCSKLLNFGKN